MNSEEKDKQLIAQLRKRLAACNLIWFQLTAMGDAVDILEKGFGLDRARNKARKELRSRVIAQPKGEEK